MSWFWYNSIFEYWWNYDNINNTIQYIRTYTNTIKGKSLYIIYIYQWEQLKKSFIKSHQTHVQKDSNNENLALLFVGSPVGPSESVLQNITSFSLEKVIDVDASEVCLSAGNVNKTYHWNITSKRRCRCYKERYHAAGDQLWLVRIKKKSQ